MLGASPRRARTKRGTRLALTFAAVLALHALGGWLLLMNTRLLVRIPTPGSIELIYLPPIIAPAEQPRRVSPSPRRSRQEPAVAPSAAPVPEAPIENRAPRIDWSAEMARAAQDAAEAASAPKPKDFGFPHAKGAQPPKAHEFGWDRAHTHRVESLAQGGLLVHLNDNCVLVFFPLPFVGCTLGHSPASGDLFKPMGEAAAESGSMQ